MMLAEQRRNSLHPSQARAKVRPMAGWPKKIWEDEDWLKTIYVLSQQKTLSEAANKIYWYFDELLCAERFIECDKVLKTVQLDLLAPELWTALLIITAAAKDKLHARAKLVADVQQRLIQLGEAPEEILHGLE